MASAYHILKNNPSKKILVVEMYGGPGQGNTGRSNAMFRNTFSSRDNQILSNSSIDFYLHLQGVMKEDIGLQQIGYLWLMSESQLSSSEPYLAAMEENGIEFRRMDSTELKRLLSGVAMDGDGGGQSSLLRLPKVEGGVFGSKCGRLDPERLANFYAKRFVEMGGRFSFNTEATGLTMGPEKRLGIEGEPFVWQDSGVEGVRLRGAIGGELHPEAVVMACGAWTNELLDPIGVDGHVKAKKRQLFSIAAKGDALEGLAHAKGFNPLGLLPLVILPRAGVHFKPNPRRLLPSLREGEGQGDVGWAVLLQHCRLPPLRLQGGQPDHRWRGQRIRDHEGRLAGEDRGRAVRE